MTYVYGDPRTDCMGPLGSTCLYSERERAKLRSERRAEPSNEQDDIFAYVHIKLEVEHLDFRTDD